jgi:hypothetical protein
VNNAAYAAVPVIYAAMALPRIVPWRRKRRLSQ